MKFLLVLTITISSFANLSSQSFNHLVKRSAKFRADSKYIITEYVFEDGHLEIFITSVPLTEFKNNETNKVLDEITENIEWDEDLEQAGFQMSLENEASISSAFNNALRMLEIQFEVEKGKLGMLNFDDDFLQLNEDQQSSLLINKLIAALSKIEEVIDLPLYEGINSKHLPQSKGVATINTRSNEQLVETETNRCYKPEQTPKITGFFATNRQEGLKHMNIRAIYNWFFADAYTGWHNRGLILKRNAFDDHETTYSKKNLEVERSSLKMLEEIIDNPTLKASSVVTFQTAGPSK